MNQNKQIERKVQFWPITRDEFFYIKMLKNKTFEDWKRISGYTLANGSHPFLSGAALFTFKIQKRSSE